MAISFNGITKLMTLSSGTIRVSAAELYSRWKDWAATSDNSKYPVAFSTVGGIPITPTDNMAAYFFLSNGWRVMPQSANHSLEVLDNLSTTEGTSPFAYPSGGYSIDIVRKYQIRTEVEAGAGDPFVGTLEGGLSRDAAFRIMLAALAGKVSGASGTMVAIRDTTDTVNRIQAIVDPDGNRTAVVLDG